MYPWELCGLSCEHLDSLPTERKLLDISKGPYVLLAFIWAHLTAEGDQVLATTAKFIGMSSNSQNSQAGWHADRRVFISATYHSLPLA